MTTFSSLLQRKEDRVLVLTINNPGKRNAIAADLYDNIRTALAAAADDPDIGAIVLTGADNYFCAGGDLELISKRRGLNYEARIERLGHLHDVVCKLRDFPKPIVAAVEGGAAGAGFSLALACDLLVASADAAFSIAYVKVGLTPDGGITGLLAQSLSRQLLTQLALTGDRITAEQLEHHGVVNKLAAAGQAGAAAITLAARLAQGPLHAMASIKALCRHAHERTLDDQLEAERTAMAVAQGGAEAAEGIAAFLGKRPADFASLRRDDAASGTAAG
ncbi:enoyl-CoA hydratase/isomerase family protein (plasmid) [Cupriavidus sp. KK10]|jgi:enoyl-CoA hydratase/carnithine racemase|uniref:oxepin-CoA hydrolase, alternative type n=1 Tax=Cupriavidus sp. KK10 TaxID=1478019 RepID=UPI001BAAD90A|nr:enoyl-CoA hydratase family protein [Cupriavidus sp. KK10]QUN32518.1 enoyl-CoA hydratase/isomerase family protein [Cupriavidus sp. KK10]